MLTVAIICLSLCAEPSRDALRLVEFIEKRSQGDAPAVEKELADAKEERIHPRSNPAWKKKQKIKDLEKKLADAKANVKFQLPGLTEMATSEGRGVAVGDIGLVTHPRVIQVIDSDEALVFVDYEIRVTVDNQPAIEARSVEFLMRGVDTSKMANNRGTDIADCFIISGTHQYTTIAGTDRTIQVIERYNPSEAQALWKQRREKADRP